MDRFYVFKTASLCSFDCFDIYQAFQCYLPEIESFGKILRFGSFKNYFPPPVNVRNGWEDILSMAEKQSKTLLQLM